MAQAPTSGRGARCPIGALRQALTDDGRKHHAIVLGQHWWLSFLQKTGVRQGRKGIRARGLDDDRGNDGMLILPWIGREGWFLDLR